MLSLKITHVLAENEAGLMLHKNRDELPDRRGNKYVGQYKPTPHFLGNIPEIML